MLSEEELKNAPVLILANKQDLPGAMDEMEVSHTFFIQQIAQGLGLPEIKRKWSLYKVSAVSGTGLDEAFQWLVD